MGKVHCDEVIYLNKSDVGNYKYVTCNCNFTICNSNSSSENMKLTACLFAAAAASPIKIIGGEDGSIEENPWQVSMRPRTGSHMCGGSIVSDKFVVTAAHCYYNPLQLVVVAGSANRLEGTDHNVVTFVIHPDYDSAGFDNDAAVISIQNTFSWSNTIAPVNIITGSTSGI